MRRWNYYYKPVSWADPQPLQTNVWDIDTPTYDAYYMATYDSDTNAWVVRVTVPAYESLPGGVIHVVVTGSGDLGTAISDVEAPPLPAGTITGTPIYAADAYAISQGGGDSGSTMSSGSTSSGPVSVGGGPATITSTGIASPTQSGATVPAPTQPKPGVGLGTVAVVAVATLGVAWAAGWLE